MAKTNRRLSARAARKAAVAAAQAAARADRAAMQALMTPHRWKQIEQTLEGLLRIDVASPFIDKKYRCPDEAWLTVRLELGQPIHGASQPLRLRLTRVLDAVAQLCTHAELLREWGDLLIDFWTRVLTSEMCEGSSASGDNVDVHEMVRFLKARGTHICLRWRGMRMDSNQVLRPVHDFLRTTHNAGATAWPVTVGLAFVDCGVTSSDLEKMRAMLQVVPTAGDHTASLCARHSLGRLSLGYNSFGLAELSVLASILEDSTTKRIDWLGLDNFEASGVSLSPDYDATFRRVLAAACTAKPSRDAGPDHGLTLSLDECSVLSDVHFRAINEALTHASRPLRKLSLASAEVESFAGWLQFGRLVATPKPTATADFVLDVTNIGGTEAQLSDAENALFVSLAELVKEAVPQLYSEGLLKQKRVTCRLLNPTVFGDWELRIQSTDAFASVSAFYRVLEVSQSGLFHIAMDDVNGRLTTVWVNSTSIATLRIGDTTVVGPNCSGLIAGEALWDRWTPRYNARWPMAVVAACGHHLQRLSMRDHSGVVNQLPEMLARCPTLEELDVTGSCLHWPSRAMKWPMLEPELTRHLEVLDVSQCSLIESARLTNFSDLVALRHLRISDNMIGVEGLESLLAAMRENTALRFVDVRRQDLDVETIYPAMRAQIEKLLRDECVTIHAKAAFLSVVPTLETRFGLQQCVDESALATIFAFAGSKGRVVLW